MSPHSHRPAGPHGAPDADGTADGGAESSGFSLDIGDDLLAEALAAVERRETEARARKRPASAEEMQSFADDLVVEEGIADADDASPDDAVSLDFEIELDDELVGEEGEDSEDGDELEFSDEGSDLEDEGVGEGVSGAVMRELTRLQARVAELGQEREQALDRAAELEDRLLESEAAREATEAELEETRLRLRKYKAARKRQLEEARRAEGALRRARDRANSAEDRASNAEVARDEAGRSLREALARLGEAEGAIEHAHQRRRRELGDQKRVVADKCWKSVLPVLDNLQLALSHAEADPSQVLAGLEMVERQFLRVLESAGVTPVPAERGQPFDPTVHEAVERAASSELPEDSVVRLLQAGYSVEGRLLRPARVAVAVAPPEPASDAADPGEPVLYEAALDDEAPSEAASGDAAPADAASSTPEASPAPPAAPPPADGEVLPSLPAESSAARAEEEPPPVADATELASNPSAPSSTTDAAD